jgi:hypothetical protein
MQDRGGMLKLARFADNRRLAVTVRLAGRNAQRLDAFLAEQRAEFFPRVDQRVELCLEAARVRVLDHGDGDCPARRRLDRLAHFNACFIHLHYQLAKLDCHFALRVWVRCFCLRCVRVRCAWVLCFGLYEAAA